MKRISLVALCILMPSIGNAQSLTFNGDIQGAFVNPIGGNTINVGTNDVTFQGSPQGRLIFTGRSDVTVSGGPILLGRIDFTAGGETPTSFTFRVGFDTQQANGTSAVAYFCPPIVSTQFGEPGFRSVDLSFGNSQWTSQLGAENYTLSLIGVTSTDVWNPEAAAESVQGIIGQPQVTGYVWGTLGLAAQGVQAQSDGSIGCGFLPPDDCGCSCPPPPTQVPEPTTWAMVASALGFTLLYTTYKRRQAKLSAV